MKVRFLVGTVLVLLLAVVALGTALAQGVGVSGKGCR